MERTEVDLETMEDGWRYWIRKGGKERVRGKGRECKNRTTCESHLCLWTRRQEMLEKF